MHSHKNPWHPRRHQPAAGPRNWWLIRPDSAEGPFTEADAARRLRPGDGAVMEQRETRPVPELAAAGRH
jgi:hypothetical protein